MRAAGTARPIGLTHPSPGAAAVMRGLGVATTWLTAAVTFAGFYLYVDLGACEHDIGHTARTVAYTTLGAIYLALGGCALLTRRSWIFPLAVLLAFGVGLAVVHHLPGSPNTDACFE